MKYFELFDLPVSLQVDKNILAKKYFELQKKYHPDFYTRADEEEQRDMLEKSSEINRALITLKHPQETIKYVLQQKGLLEEEEKYQLPQSFLMEMMDLNEQLGNGTGMAIEDMENQLFNEVKSIIENYNDTLIKKEELLKVKEYYFKKKYLKRILDRIDD